MRTHRTDCDGSNCDRSCPTMPDTEHTRKYEALAQRIGVDVLRALLVGHADRIRHALAAGDEHLNTINLAWWDSRAGLKSATLTTRMWSNTWPTSHMTFDYPWTPSVANGLSLAEPRVRSQACSDLPPGGRIMNDGRKLTHRVYCRECPNPGALLRGALLFVTVKRETARRVQSAHATRTGHKAYKYLIVGRLVTPPLNGGAS